MELKEYLQWLLEKIKKAQEERKKRERINKELDEICKELADFKPKIFKVVDSNNADLQTNDKKRLEELTKKYDELLKELIKLAGFESPWNLKIL